MAYTLQAILAEESLNESDLLEAIRFVRLPQGLLMIPFTETFCQAGKIELLPLLSDYQAACGKISLPKAIENLCTTLSAGSKLAYVEAEFFAGEGMQAAVLFHDGGQVGDVKVELRAINFALEFLGVEIGSAQDRFEAVGLDAHRDTEAWLD